MLKNLLILLLIIFGFKSYSQNHKNIKSIIEFENGITSKISKFDTKGNVIFWKNYKKGNPILIGGVYYDSLRRKTKSILVRQSSSFKISIFEYNNLKNKKKIYTYSKSDKKLNIFDYQTREQLSNDKNVLMITENFEYYIIYG